MVPQYEPLTGPGMHDSAPSVYGCDVDPAASGDHRRGRGGSCERGEEVVFDADAVLEEDERRRARCVVGECGEQGCEERGGGRDFRDVFERADDVGIGPVSCLRDSADNWGGAEYRTILLTTRVVGPGNVPLNGFQEGSDPSCSDSIFKPCPSRERERGDD